VSRFQHHTKLYLKTVNSRSLWHSSFYIILRLMRFQVLIRLVLKQNKHDPQLTAKPNTRAYYVYDDVNWFIAITSD
jgi:hypothetical protein